LANDAKHPAAPRRPALPDVRPEWLGLWPIRLDALGRQNPASLAPTAHKIPSRIIAMTKPIVSVGIRDIFHSRPK
jgi:hypothetical protein